MIFAVNLQLERAVALIAILSINARSALHIRFYVGKFGNKSSPTLERSKPSGLLPSILNPNSRPYSLVDQMQLACRNAPICIFGILKLVPSLQRSNQMNSFEKIPCHCLKDFDGAKMITLWIKFFVPPTYTCLRMNKLSCMSDSISNQII